MDEEGEEDGDAEGGVGVVGRVGDEAFGEFMQGDSDAGLEADGEEGVGGDVVVVVVRVVVVGGGGGGGVCFVEGGAVFEGCGTVVWIVFVGDGVVSCRGFLEVCLRPRFLGDVL